MLKRNDLFEIYLFSERQSDIQQNIKIKDTLIRFLAINPAL